MATDFELLDAWKGGDKAAGNALFQRHFDGVCRFFRNKVGEGVDDLIQRTFLACVESRDKFRKEASFRTYLFTLARNELYAHFKRSHRQQERIDPLVTSVHDMGPSATALVAQAKEQRLLLEALRRIPVDHQITLELYYWEGMSAAQLGRVLDVPEGTIRTRIRRAKSLVEAALRELDASPEPLRSTLADIEGWARSLREVVEAERQS
ncbi:MAG: sigma-70 family RNA polymerase sigma factor [Myxococcales bacterium]|nr:sigma-70 family RNA polymerase sigma factor [Myxococcales bacterium]MCB9714496.1 sigma-70 family RNA polymerase sigma factor [Myxococcales bacterium]